MDDVVKAALFKACRALGWEETRITFRDSIDRDHPRSYSCFITDTEVQDHHRAMCFLIEHIRANRNKAPASRPIFLRVSKPREQRRKKVTSFSRETVLRVLSASLLSDETASCSGCQDAMARETFSKFSEPERRHVLAALRDGKDEHVQIEQVEIEIQCCIEYLLE
jgi:hypothetical protein